MNLALPQSILHPSAVLTCRNCAAVLGRPFLDLGMQPLANDLVPADASDAPETRYPLRAWVCERCWLMQTHHGVNPARIFGARYPFFSGVSAGWVTHCREFAANAKAVLGLTAASQVVEIGSNDGTMLEQFRDCHVLGFEPSWSVARVAIDRGLATYNVFFSRQEAIALGRCADLVIATNVLAHVPDLHDVLSGIALILKPGGTVVIEFPDVVAMLEKHAFDTVYHEHFSYFSARTMIEALERHDLSVTAVDGLAMHGGSLRLWATNQRPLVIRAFGVHEPHPDAFADLASAAADVKCHLLHHLITAREASKKVCGYGAAAKGNTLLNYCGIGPELLPYVVDATLAKQGMLLPGSRIPVVSPEVLDERRPDYVLILPWNWADEIAARETRMRAWGGRFVTAIPKLRVF